jgi:hypothetical protein
VAPGQIDVAYVDCPAGKKVIAGAGGSAGDAPILLTGPYANRDWAVAARNDGASPVSISAWAYCAYVS